MLASPDSPTSKERLESPLCTDGYRLPLPSLPHVVPPRWMYVAMLWGAILTVIVCVITLLSPMDEYVTAPGEVRPADFAYVFSRSSGILESIDFEAGKSVKKGQILARLDSWEIRKQIVQIEGEIAQTEAELAMAQATTRKVAAAPVPAEFLFSGVEMERQQEIKTLQKNYLDRLEQLEKTGAASGVEMMNLRLQLIASESMLKRSQQANALFEGDFGAASQAEAEQRGHMIEARLNSLKAKRDLARQDLKRQEIVAPEDGVILVTSARLPGEKIEAGTPLFKITDVDKTQLRLYAGEDRINLIRPGQLVRFRANNNPDRLAPFASGRVSSVAKDRDLATTDNDSTPQRTYRVRVEIEKEPYPLAVGATVQAEIVIERRPFWRLLFLKPLGSGA